MAFAEKLSALMDDGKITAYKVWKDTGLQQSMLGRWCKGEQEPLSKSRDELAKYFNVPIKYFTEAPPFDMWDYIKNRRESLLHYMYLPMSLFEKLTKVRDINEMSLVQFINFVDSTVEDIRLTEEGDFDLTLKPWLLIQRDAKNVFSNYTSGKMHKEKPADQEADEYNENEKLLIRLFRSMPEEQQILYLTALEAGLKAQGLI